MYLTFFQKNNISIIYSLNFRNYDEKKNFIFLLLFVCVCVYECVCVCLLASNNKL